MKYIYTLNVAKKKKLKKNQSLVFNPCSQENQRLLFKQLVHLYTSIEQSETIQQVIKNMSV